MCSAPWDGADNHSHIFDGYERQQIVVYLLRLVVPKMNVAVAVAAVVDVAVVVDVAALWLYEQGIGTTRRGEVVGRGKDRNCKDWVVPHPKIDAAVPRTTQ